MEGELAAASSEQAVPAIAPESEETTEKPIDLQQPEGQAEPEEQPEDDGLDDLEFGFKKYRVPKDLKADVENWRSATTKKEQTIAEQTRALEARATQQAEADEGELQHRAVLANVKAQLKQYEGVDWLQLSRDDPYGYNQHRAYVDQLKDAQANAEKGIADAATKRTEAQQADFAKRIQETREFAQTKIKGWSPEIDQKLQEFAVSKGVNPQFIERNMSPLLYEVLHLAWIGEQAQRTAAQIKPAPQTVVPLAPLEKVAGKSAPAASKTLNDLAKSGDMEAYVAARKAGRVR